MNNIDKAARIFKAIFINEASLTTNPAHTTYIYTWNDLHWNVLIIRLQHAMLPVNTTYPIYN